MKRGRDVKLLGLKTGAVLGPRGVCDKPQEGIWRRDTRVSGAGDTRQLIN